VNDMILCSIRRTNIAGGVPPPLWFMTSANIRVDQRRRNET
jgi:hypothetical protein